jgi:hypothetical protein
MEYSDTVTPPLAPKSWRWRVEGDSTYFSPFWVEAPNLRYASARANDILAGADRDEPPYASGRHYNTVENHIISITREDKVPE